MKVDFRGHICCSSAKIQIVWKSCGGGHKCTNFQAHIYQTETACVYLTECDLMHCELNVTWELFVKSNNDYKYI